jgi:2-keto-4-pentenoate hydratase/2-oxohepta-3-ene-1,7-dioic acid hydratase in catechol pathway
MRKSLERRSPRQAAPRFCVDGIRQRAKPSCGAAAIQGPYFVSADLVDDPNNLGISTRVDGELRQNSNTKNFIFNVQRAIAYTSTLFALEPGDIIVTGTPPGVLVGMPKAKQVWLKAGLKAQSKSLGR